MTSRLEGVRAIQLRQQGRVECFAAGDSLIHEVPYPGLEPGSAG